MIVNFFSVGPGVYSSTSIPIWGRVVHTPLSAFLLRHQISLRLWSCTRRVICPGDNLLCAASLQFLDRSWERWGRRKFCQYNRKNIPTEQYVFTDYFQTWSFFYSLLLHDSEHPRPGWLWTIGLSLLDYLPYILR
jgi:hypothetical protein